LTEPFFASVEFLRWQVLDGLHQAVYGHGNRNFKRRHLVISPVKGVPITIVAQSI